MAALLYAISAEVAFGQNKNCTEKLQHWHRPAKKTLETSALVSDIKTPTTSRVFPELRHRRDNFDPRPHEARTVKSLADFNLAKLSQISRGKAAVLLYSDRSPSQSSCAAPNLANVETEQEVTTMIEPLPVVSSFQKLKPPSSAAFLESMHFNDREKRTSVETMTRQQSGSAVWKNHRKGRMTASIMHDILTHVDDDGNTVGQIFSVMENVMGYNRFFTAKSTQHGINNENTVVKKYRKDQRHHHKSLKVLPSGLWVYDDLPVIAASPDGVVMCFCCQRRLLEVKCPYTERFKTVEQYAQQGTSVSRAKHKTIIIVENGAVVVNKAHRYYTQVQTQILCTGLGSCDLVIGTMSKVDNFRVFKITRDAELCSIIVKKAKAFYECNIFPELQDKKYFAQKQQKEAQKKLVT